MAFQGADPGIVGGSYPATLILQDTQRTINFYPEKSPEPRSKETIALLGCPGLNTLIATQLGAVRGMWVLPGAVTALVVTGNTLYLITNTVPGINGASPLFTATVVGTLLTSLGPVVMRDNGVLQNGLGGYCIIVDGSYAYYYLLSGVTYTNQFTGSLITGSATLTFPGELPNGLIVASTPTLSATSGAIPSGTMVIYIDTIGLTLTMSQNATATTTGVAITFTTPLALGATSGTLTPVWSGTTGSYTIQFSDNETRLVTLTNGSGAVSWTPGLTGAVLAAANTVSGNTTEAITLTIPPFGQITDQGFLGADHIAFIEGFLVFNQPQSRTFFCTGPTPYQVLFPGLFFALKDSSTDNLVTLYEENRELWLVGERTSEVWYNAGGGNFPFARIPGVGPQIGCAATYSIARAGAQLVWLGRNEQGQNIIVCTNQYTWARISTHAVEHAISSYSTVSDAIGYGYEEEGHLFYMLIFPTADATWCFDFTSEFWHERASWDPDVGIYHRHRSNCFMNFANVRIVGDYQTGNLMQMSRQFYSDNGNPLRALRRTPHVWAKQTRERVFFSQLQIEFMPAVGSPNGGISSGPNGPGISYDPYYDDVALLLHMDGGNGSSTFIDSSSNDFLVTSHSATIEITNVKFGTGALNSGGYLTVPIIAGGPLDLSALNPWTVEFWLNLPSTNVAHNTIGLGDDGSSNWIIIQMLGTGSPNVFSVAGQFQSGLTGGTFGSDTTNYTTGTWIHVALVSNGHQLQTYIGGLANDSPVLLGAGPSAPWSGNIFIGACDNGGPVNAQYIDEVRITKGVARYTANFIPPLYPFPNTAIPPPPLGINPQAMLRWSSDAGQTWSNEHWVSIGRAGRTKNRAMWRQLGEARDRVWEVVVTDPVRRDIIGATLFAEGSSS